MTDKQCDQCTPLGMDHFQKPGESAVWVPRMAEWLCSYCRRAKGVTDIPLDDGLYPGIHELDYHCDLASLSHSGARNLLPPNCPAKFKYERDNFDPAATTAAMNFGSAVHSLVLKAGLQIVVIGDDFKTAAARAARDAAFQEGLIPLKKSEYAVAQDMAAAVNNHPLARRLLDSGSTEMSGWWHDEVTGVRLRYRLDCLKRLSSGRLLGVDYKTAESADPATFGRNAPLYGYDQQHAWYLAGLSANVQDRDEVAGFLDVVQEKKPPYLVSVVELDAEAVTVAAQLNRQAIDLYARCTETGHWPGYGDDNIHTVSLPAWRTIEVRKARDELR